MHRADWTVILVDPNNESRAALSYSLGKAGLTLTEALDGTATPGEIADADADAIIIDSQVLKGFWPEADWIGYEEPSNGSFYILDFFDADQSHLKENLSVVCQLAKPVSPRKLILKLLEVKKKQ